MQFEKLRIILVFLALFFLLTGLVAVASADFTGRIDKIQQHDADEDNLEIVVIDEKGDSHIIIVSLTEGKDFKVGDSVKVTEFSNGIKTLEKIEEVNSEVSSGANSEGISEEYAAVPEFPTVALPMITVFGLIAAFGTRNKKI